MGNQIAPRIARWIARRIARTIAWAINRERMNLPNSLEEIMEVMMVFHECDAASIFDDSLRIY